jgi:two-component system nitrate/nitrite response regulator NarL
MRILLVDGQNLSREGLASLLSSQPGFVVVGEAGCARDALPAARSLKPDVVLTEFYLPDASGPDTARLMLAEQPNMAIVFLTTRACHADLVAALSAGARGFLLKSIAASRLVAGLRGIEQGEVVIHPQMLPELILEFVRLSASAGPAGTGQESQHDCNELTARELQVLHHLAQGASNQEIASQLVISINTVKNHMTNILGKLQLPNRQSAAVFARSQGY